MLWIAFLAGALFGSTSVSVVLSAIVAGSRNEAA